MVTIVHVSATEPGDYDVSQITAAGLHPKVPTTPPPVGRVIRRTCSLKQTAEEMNKGIKRTIGERGQAWMPIRYVSGILIIRGPRIAVGHPGRVLCCYGNCSIWHIFFGAGCLVSKPSSTPLSLSLSLSFSLSLSPFLPFPQCYLAARACVSVCVCVGGQNVCCSAQSSSLSGSSGSTHTFRFSSRPLIQVTPRFHFYWCFLCVCVCVCSWLNSSENIFYQQYLIRTMTV